MLKPVHAAMCHRQRGMTLVELLVGIAVGMVLFAVCDVALGLGEALRMPVLRRVVPDLTYTLALLGVVLSTVDWDPAPRPGRTTI